MGDTGQGGAIDADADGAGFAPAPAQDETLRRMAGAQNYNEWLFARVRPYLGGRVLDAGAGIGTFVEMIADECETVVAAEPDRRFTPVLRRRFAERTNVEILERDLTALGANEVPWPFNLVVCFNSLEHIPDDEAALAALRFQLAPGGRLLLLVPAHPFLFGTIDRMLGHERRYRKGSLRQRLEEAGFAVESLRHVNPVGALGWLAAGRLLRRELIPTGSLRLYDRVVPLLRSLDRVELPFGLSLWAVARRTS